MDAISTFFFEEIELAKYLPSIISAALMQMFAVSVPGANFAVTVRNSIIYSREIAFYTVLGIVFGILLHMVYIAIGIGIIILNHIWLFDIIRYGGSFYLIGSGVYNIFKSSKEFGIEEHKQKKDISKFAAFRSGLLTNLTNPFSILFYVSYTSAFFAPNTPFVILLVYTLEAILIALCWYLLLAFVFSTGKFQSYLASYHHVVKKITGLFFVFIGLKILLQ
jgi:threonine/homoserine/homoserine lactone efflux protein